MAFTKLFSQILDSTIWDEPWEVKGVWITMLAMADSRGRVLASIPGLARRATVSIEQAERAVQLFLGADKYSRTPDFDGRRLEIIDGGWRILNYVKYREMRDEDARKEYQREWVKDKRCRQNLSTVDQEKPQSTQAEAEAEAEKDKKHSSEPAVPDAAKKPKRVPKIRTTGLKAASEEAFALLWGDVPKSVRQWDKGLRDFVDKPINKGSRLKAETRFQAIVDAGHATPYELYAAYHMYLAEEPKVEEGFIQAPENFLGPEKATWLQWLDRARQAIAESQKVPA